jgi:hypothetical protein
MKAGGLVLQNLIQPTISLEMPQTSQEKRKEASPIL